MFCSFNSLKLVATLCVLCFAASSSALSEKLEKHRSSQWQKVSGSAVHYFPTNILHSSRPTDTGKIEQSTDTIDLIGDLKGRIVYHVTSEFNFVEGTLTNIGTQVFSGTVLNSNPVLLLDDEFWFQVNLNTGETNGRVYLTRRLDGQKTECELKIVGTGMDAQGNGLADYSGRCRVVKKKCDKPRY